MVKKLFRKALYGLKFLMAMVITAIYFFLSNKDNDEGDQRTIKKRFKNNFYDVLDDDDIEYEIKKVLKKEPRNLKEYEDEINLLFEKGPTNEVFKSLRVEATKHLEELQLMKDDENKINDESLEEDRLYNEILEFLKKDPLDIEKYEADLKELFKKSPDTEKFKELKEKAKRHCQIIKSSLIKELNTQEKVPIIKDNFNDLSKKNDTKKKEQVKKDDYKKVDKRIVITAVNVPVVLGISNMAFRRNDKMNVKGIFQNRNMLLNNKASNVSRSLSNNLGKGFVILKQGSLLALNPRLVLSMRNARFQNKLNDATLISKEIDIDSKRKDEIVKKKENKINKVSNLLSGDDGFKRMFAFKLFGRKDVKNLVSASLLNHKLISSVNVLNDTDFSYQKVSFLTFLNRKKIEKRMEEITEKNLEAILMLKTSIQNRYSKVLDNSKVTNLMEKIDKMEKKLNQKSEANNKKKSKVKSKSLFAHHH